jgi:hypothetical protein
LNFEGNKEEARSKLNKALENAETAEAVQENESTQSEAESENEETPAKRTRVKKEEKDDKKSIVKVEDIKPAIVQASYVMKLFDRSVNLAKFDEETPLYSLCRDWMKNCPRGANPSERDSSNIQTVEEGDVVEIPRVRIRKGQRPYQPKKETKVKVSDIDKAIDSETWTKEKLLESHRSKWQEDRSKPISSIRAFQEKHFGANLELLESLVAAQN